MKKKVKRTKWLKTIICSEKSDRKTQLMAIKMMRKLKMEGV